MSNESSFSRHAGLVASIAACVAGVGLVAPQVSSAQTRPALIRDTDNPDLAPAFFAGTFPLNTAANTIVTTVPAGKRLVVDGISYSYGTTASSDPLNQAYLYAATSQGGNQVRQYFPINPPHAYTTVGGSTAQDASFAGRTYFEAGEIVRFIGGTVSSDASRTIGLTITGHYVTP